MSCVEGGAAFDFRGEDLWVSVASVEIVEMDEPRFRACEGGWEGVGGFFFFADEEAAEEEAVEEEGRLEEEPGLGVDPLEGIE